jgi:hypothetical protein
MTCHSDDEVTPRTCWYFATIVGISQILLLRLLLLLLLLLMINYTGCGWGSLTLHLIRKFPNCKITSISNSHSQREYILSTAKERGYNFQNINVITVCCLISNLLYISAMMYSHAYFLFIFCSTFSILL